MKITTSETATLLNCSPRNVRYLIDKGYLNPVMKHQRLILLDKDEVLTFKSTRYEK